MGRCPIYATAAVHPGIPPLIDFQVPAARAGVAKLPLTIRFVVLEGANSWTLEMVTP